MIHFIAAKTGSSVSALPAQPSSLPDELWTDILLLGGYKHRPLALLGLAKLNRQLYRVATANTLWPALYPSPPLTDAYDNISAARQNNYRDFLARSIGWKKTERKLFRSLNTISDKDLDFNRARTIVAGLRKWPNSVAQSEDFLLASLHWFRWSPSESRETLATCPAWRYVMASDQASDTLTLALARNLEGPHAARLLVSRKPHLLANIELVSILVGQDPWIMSDASPRVQSSERALKCYLAATLRDNDNSWPWALLDIALHGRGDLHNPTLTQLIAAQPFGIRHETFTFSMAGRWAGPCYERVASARTAKSLQLLVQELFEGLPSDLQKIPKVAYSFACISEPILRALPNYLGNSEALYAVYRTMVGLAQTRGRLCIELDFLTQQAPMILRDDLFARAMAEADFGRDMMLCDGRDSTQNLFHGQGPYLKLFADLPTQLQSLPNLTRALVPQTL